MKINILTLPEEGLHIQFVLDEKSFPDLIAEKKTGDFFLHQVGVSANIQKVSQNIFFSGSLETTVETSCSRCLEIVTVPLQANFKYTLLPEVPLGKEEIELRTEDLDVAYYAGEMIDLDPIIYEQILLLIPMKPLCRESCRGLCPYCGTNLNAEPCDCQAPVDERFALLKNLKINEKGLRYGKPR